MQSGRRGLLTCSTLPTVTRRLTFRLDDATERSTLDRATLALVQCAASFVEFTAVGFCRLVAAIALGVRHSVAAVAAIEVYRLVVAFAANACLLRGVIIVLDTNRLLVAGVAFYGNWCYRQKLSTWLAQPRHYSVVLSTTMPPTSAGPSQESSTPSTQVGEVCEVLVMSLGSFAVESPSPVAAGPGGTTALRLVPGSRSSSVRLWRAGEADADDGWTGAAGVDAGDGEKITFARGAAVDVADFTVEKAAPDFMNAVVNMPIVCFVST